MNILTHNISIFCKSYLPDMHRAKAMASSVRQYNRDALPLYISVPEKELEEFKRTIDFPEINWLTDEEIIRSNPEISVAAYHALPGSTSQQIVKAEFWRVNPVENCVCIDSDSRFIRDFYASDFLSAEGVPYTILFEGKNFLQFCMVSGIRETSLYYEKMSDDMKRYFGRQGPSYSFNPFPVIWSRRVWESLQEKLREQNTNILDALAAHPYESSWYGEALLKYRAIPLLPKEPIFKAYLYLEEYEHDKAMGINEQVLTHFYLGVVYQSNWYPHRLKLLKNLAYKLKRKVQKLRK